MSCRYRSMLISRSPTANRSCTLPYRTHWPLAPLRKATSSSDAQAGVWVNIRRLYHGYADVLRFRRWRGSRMKIDPATLAAYRQTEYRVFGASPAILRVGVRCPELAAL